MKLEIDKELAQAILNYLALKPFNEVHQLVAAIVSLKEIKEEKADD